MTAHRREFVVDSLVDSGARTVGVHPGRHRRGPAPAAIGPMNGCKFVGSSATMPI